MFSLCFCFRGWEVQDLSLWFWVQVSPPGHQVSGDHQVGACVCTCPCLAVGQYLLKSLLQFVRSLPLQLQLPLQILQLHTHTHTHTQGHTHTEHYTHTHTHRHTQTLYTVWHTQHTHTSHTQTHAQCITAHTHTHTSFLYLKITASK